MKQIADRLHQIISEYAPALQSISAADYAFKPNPAKWSKKEIMGHLIDSAQNNIRRFIVSQYEEDPLILYNQEKWVAACHYQDFPVDELLGGWVFLNRQVCAILSQGEASATRVCLTNNNQPHTIEWLAEDYIRHLLHHLHQVVDRQPVPYP